MKTAKPITETIPALDFIKKLIVHIPEKQRFLRSIQNWQQAILLSFRYDPLCCSKYVTSMLVLEAYHKKCTILTISKGYEIWINPCS